MHRDPNGLRNAKAERDVAPSQRAAPMAAAQHKAIATINAEPLVQSHKPRPVLIKPGSERL
jgi:hypothetical protein